MVLGNVREEFAEERAETACQNVDHSAFSPIFMMPIQSESTPVRPREISKAVLAELNVESMMAGNTPASPAKTNFPAAMRNAMPKNATQM